MSVLKHAWERFTKKKKEWFYDRWIREILKDETVPTIRRHIVRHAKEVYTKDPKIWSASMHNLIEIFDRMYKSKPDVETKLRRLDNKYRKNTKRYTAPPEI